MQGDTNAAVEFLLRFYPKGPWVLTSIDPSKKGIETRTFTLEQLEDMRTWIAGWNGRRNIYFSEAEPIRPVSKKMERTDVRRVWYLHVDIDARAGEDLDDELARARSLVTTNLPDGVPPPTFVVFSGGGYQAHWRLAEPILIDGDLDKAEDAKLWNIQLERLFAADNCHNIDRIMRLPGTVNVPDEKKRKKGRKDALATLEIDNDEAYGFDAFTKAQPVQIPSVHGGAGSAPEAVRVEISGNIPRLESVDDLDEWDVPNRVRVIIVQGKDELNPKQGDNSRSAWLFDVVCNLVRCGVPDDVIYSIITDPDFLISASVLDKKSNAEKYAVGQIKKAKEKAIDPVLQEFNTRFAVIENFGGMPKVIEELDDAAYGRPRLSKMSFSAFKERFCNRRVQIGMDKNDNPTYMEAGKWWIMHPARRQYHTIIFNPGGEAGVHYNMWRGFRCEARPGDCDLFLQHVRDNICRGDEEHYEYLLRWMARAVQRPASAGQIAVVLRGGQGTGKGVFAKTFGHLFGRHFLHISNSSHLVGNFNAHLRDSVVLFADEAFYAGDKKHESVLKTLVTEEVLAIEAKGVDVEMSPNYTHIVMASNHDWVVPAGSDERRYFVLDVGEEHKQDTKYFKAILHQMKNGGYEALLHHLSTLDIREFNVRDFPRTQALHDQKIMSLSPEESWWYGRLQDGAVLSSQTAWKTEVVKEDLYEDYIDHAKDAGHGRRAVMTVLGMFLNKVCPGIYPRAKRAMAKRAVITDDGYQVESTKRLPHYVFPTLDECREHWDKIYGKANWASVTEDDDPDPEIPF